jgi:hypothetical protein
MLRGMLLECEIMGGEENRRLALLLTVTLSVVLILGVAIGASCVRAHHSVRGVLARDAVVWALCNTNPTQSLGV